MFQAAAWAQATPAMPQYSTSSVVNAATQMPSGFSPYTVVTIYGKNLSNTTQSISSADVAAGVMPEYLSNTLVYFGGIQVGLFYVSPNQVNFLIPYEFTPGTYEVRVLNGAFGGPAAFIRLDLYSPGFFTYNNSLIATHADGTLITDASRASQGEVIVIYAVGLGPTFPDATNYRIPNRAAPLLKSTPLQVLFDGTAASKSNILYSGATPGCAGLYQINIKIPDGTSRRPTVQIQIGAFTSPSAVLASVN